MTEIRFEAKDNTIDVIDGYCAASGKCQIREACISECRPGEEGLKALQQRVSDAAERAVSAA